MTEFSNLWEVTINDRWQTTAGGRDALEAVVLAGHLWNAEISDGAPIDKISIRRYTSVDDLANSPAGAADSIFVELPTT